MEAFDVIIVGGGPAGSSCAWKLRLAGRNVAVIDRKRFPRDKPCAGWITPQVVQALQFDVDAYRPGRTWQAISGFSCGIIGGREVEVDYGRPVSFGIRRCEFDAFLLARAGGEQRLEEPVERIERQGPGWIVNGRYTAPLLVGAGGNFCPVARWLGARKQTAAPAVVAQEIEFPCIRNGSGKVRGHCPALYFCKDLRGYGWCFRKGDYLNVGLGRTDAEGFSTHLARFREFLEARGIPWTDGHAPWKGHAYQLYDRAQPILGDEGVLLIGDAAGLAYAQSGEGIRPAIESALIAAGAILDAGGGDGRDLLKTYRTRLEARLGKPGRTSVLGCLPAAWLASLAAGLLGTRWFSRHVVMDRWFLHRADAALSA
jgi:flavin-dependent dehydrogenase